MLAGSELESATPEINDPSESGRRAQTWFFRAIVCLTDGKTFSNLLDARKQLLETSLASPSVISWAFANTTSLESPDSNCVILEGFVHASTEIRLGSLKRVLPEKQETDAGEIVEAAFAHHCSPTTVQAASEVLRYLRAAARRSPCAVVSQSVDRDR